METDFDTTGLEERVARKRLAKHVRKEINVMLSEGSD
jgi:hypothetical protein